MLVRPDNGPEAGLLFGLTPSRCAAGEAIRAARLAAREEDLRVEAMADWTRVDPDL